MGWYFRVLKKYIGFGGRARRKEYWMFFLFNNIISIVLAIIPPLLLLYGLLVLLPSLAVQVRRLHDTGRTGLWIFIGLIPLIGTLLLLVFTLEDGEGDNEYGIDPKGSEVWE
ncbi:uncharacterized membrane protein YhaH (DUF805 family) [Paenibacillus sp. DS2015]|uniref:DUF805 domain-containing protein n=1 Tax=Paenibacillus sp. DS2015 TaxID=3373917 RepID=UPI003D262E0D